jgi:hypothetical protein
MSPRATPDSRVSAQLPLPLAQLYHLAHNETEPVRRHARAMELWEAALKLFAANVLVSAARSGPTEMRGLPGVEPQTLRRPSLGHWRGFIRLLLPALADRGQASFAAVRALLGEPLRNFPGAVALGNLVRPPAGGAGLRLDELFDGLVTYRNDIAHGTAGPLDDATLTERADVLLAAATAILSRLDVLAGHRLVFVQPAKQVGDSAVAEWFDLTGLEMPLRPTPLAVPWREAGRLPPGGRVYLHDPEAGGEPRGLTPLYPLLLVDPGHQQAWFFNGSPGKRKLKFLCYTTGGERAEPGDGLTELLGGTAGEAESEPGAGPGQPSGGRSRRRRLALAAGLVGLAVLLGAAACWLWCSRPCSVDHGQELEQAGRVDDAIRCYEEAIHDRPDDSEDHGFPERAAAYRRKGIPTCLEAWGCYKLGVKSQIENHYPKAVEQYRRAVHLDPDLFWAANNLSFLLATCDEQSGLRDPEEAMTYARLACDRAGQRCWHTLDTLAIARAANQDFPAAVQAARDALRLTPTDKLRARAQMQFNLRRFQDRKPYKTLDTADDGR